jgi:hypothetical protein
MLSVLSHERDGDVWRLLLGERRAKKGAVDLGPVNAVEILFAADDERWADATPKEALKLQRAVVEEAFAERD